MGCHTTCWCRSRRPLLLGPPTVVNAALYQHSFFLDIVVLELTALPALIAIGVQLYSVRPLRNNSIYFYITLQTTRCCVRRCPGIAAACAVMVLISVVGVALEPFISLFVEAISIVV